jgi:hypothetical protein
MQGRTEAEAQHDDRGQTNAWWPRGHMPRSSASVPHGRAEPAPPRRGQSQCAWPSGENPGIMRGEVFRRGAVSAPGWQGRRRAGVWRDYGRVGERPVAEWGDVSVGVMPTLRACGARPSEARASRGYRALRDEAPRMRGRWFFGGTRSPRPDAEAVIKPRHSIPTG